MKVETGKNGQYLVLCDGIPTWGGCLPVPVTDAPTDIKYNGVTFNGYIESDGGTPITDKGFLFGKKLNQVDYLA